MEHISKLKDIDETIPYCLTEKVHGTNFRISFDGETFKYGKRNTELSPNSSFYDWKTVVRNMDIENKIQKVYSEERLEGEYTFFFELFGHGVQKGIYYGTGKYLYGIDIADENGFLSYHVTMIIFAKMDVYYALPIFIGPYNNCIDFIQNYLEKTPSFLSFLIEGKYEQDNIIEGVVMRPLVEEGHHLLAKAKTEKFKEVQKKKLPKEKVELTEEELEVLSQAMSYINDNRFNNVIGNLGVEPDIRNFSVIGPVFYKDIMEDLEADNIIIAKKLRRILGKEINNYLRKKLNEIS